MLLASNSGAGQNMGFPNVCNTPQPTGTVPIPYPNIASNAMAAGFSQIVRITGMNALNQMTKINMTNGDEAGVAHSSFMKAGGYQTGNPIVSVDMMPAINLVCPTNGNNMNNPSGVVAVPSVTTVFYTLHPAALQGPPSAESPMSAPSLKPLSRRALKGLGAALQRPETEARQLTEKVAYLRLAAFAARTPTDVFRALRKLGGERLRGLVLDLRANPGGDTTAMAQLADDFLPRDAIILRQIDAEGEERLLRARQDDPYPQALVLLVDGGTASAAELFAGCLQQHRRALVVGQRTFGKGSMQRVLPAAGHGQAVYAHVARCLLPGGTEVEGRGITPDHLATPADGAGDPALALALELLSR